MKSTAFLAFLLLAFSLPLPAQPVSGAEIGAATIVKIETTGVVPNMARPWARQTPDSRVGSGVIIEGRRILTNAHNVHDPVLIDVRREGGSRRYPAAVRFVNHQCDLALLSVEDPEFFEGVVPLPMGGLPRLRDQVEVIGYPVGGESMSITAGIVSRIEVESYVHSEEHLLLLQVDAAINPGNSGGPVVSEGALVGIAMQMIPDAENVAYAIPVPVIQHFLEDVADGRVDGFPGLGIRTQIVRNPAMRRRYSIPEDRDGLLVLEVAYGASAWGHLKPGDIILEIDGRPLDDEAKVAGPDGHRVKFTYLVNRLQVGESLTVGFLREGQPMTARFQVGRYSPLVPRYLYDSMPEYLLFGGMLFQEMTGPYLKLFPEVPGNLERFRTDEMATAERRRVVLLNRVFPHAVNAGYHDMEDLVLTSIDGHPIRDLAHLERRIDTGTSPYVEIATESGMRIILDRKAALEAEASLLATYSIPAARSK